MNANDFDALMGQGFNTLDKVAASNAGSQMTQQAIDNIRSFQSMPTATGYIPDHTVLPVFERQAALEQEAAARKAREEAQFFVLLNGEQKGPLSLEQLKGLAIADVINEESQVWRQGTPEWTDLKSCLESIH